MDTVTTAPDTADLSLPIPSSRTIAALVTALAKAQGQFPDIGKGKRADIQTRGGARYSYAYADLATVIAAIRPPLAANELSLSQPVAVAGGMVHITTILFHASGEWISTLLTLPVNDPTDVRSLASAITYAKRYSVLSFLAIAPADEDDDGAGAVAPEKPATVKAKADPRPSESRPAIDLAQLSDSTAPRPAMITDAQRRRLFAIATGRGWSKDDLHTWLTAQGIGSTTKIRVEEYDTVCGKLLMADGPLTTAESGG
jgi:hypothetical protein